MKPLSNVEFHRAISVEIHSNERAIVQSNVRKVPDARNTADNGNKCPMLNENHCAQSILYTNIGKNKISSHLLNCIIYRCYLFQCVFYCIYFQLPDFKFQFITYLFLLDLCFPYVFFGNIHFYLIGVQISRYMYIRTRHFLS